MIFCKSHFSGQITLFVAVHCHQATKLLNDLEFHDSNFRPWLMPVHWAPTHTLCVLIQFIQNGKHTMLIQFIKNKLFGK